ncbi:hypothetical protein [Spirosoma areae]
MTYPLTIPQLFANSQVNPQVVVYYIGQQDGYYKEAIKNPCHPKCLELIQHADRVDAELRWFLAGNGTRLTRIYRAIRHFIGLNPAVGRIFTALVVEDIRNTLLVNEWYELLPRFELARSRIQRRFKL